jgi:hypothetical protein
LSEQTSAAESDPTEEGLARVRKSISRRVFLGRTSVAAGAAAALAAVPGLGSLLSSGETEAPELGGTAGAGAAASEIGSTGAGSVASSGTPLIAHVVDASTGEINLYQGTEQIVTRNPQLAQALLRAAGR